MVNGNENKKQHEESKMSNFTKAIKTIMGWIGHDKRSGDERRLAKVKRKTTKRKNARRK